MRYLFAALAVLGTVFPSKGATLHVGKQYPFKNLMQAASAARPGDTILFHKGIYEGNQSFGRLQGQAGRPIVITAPPGDTVIHRGGENGWSLSDAAYLHIENMIFEGQTANGLNIDDGGSYDTPSHHLVLRNCIFRNMLGKGNNDLLKLSGVDFFEIRNCRFLNGSPGGSGMDMVGCHSGIISANHFQNMGHNSIQAKGGSRYISIERNFFRDGGIRTLNLGGSTGMQFFRPADAAYEAADLQVFANVITGSLMPVAFVGCIRAEVSNNTIYRPGKWVIGILQETIGPRFAPCGNNTFRNNIIYRGNNAPDCNIASNTDPASFSFSHNLWFNYEDRGRSRPVGLPVAEHYPLIGLDPLFRDAAAGDFSLTKNSPAQKAGQPGLPVLDFTGKPYLAQRSVGAFELD